MVPKPVRSAQSLKKKGIPQLAVSHLKVKRSHAAEINPCVELMSAMLGKDTRYREHRKQCHADLVAGCYASSGQTAMPCLALEQQLRMCMDTKVISYIRLCSGSTRTNTYIHLRIGPRPLKIQSTTNYLGFTKASEALRSLKMDNSTKKHAYAAFWDSSAWRNDIQLDTSPCI